MSRELPQYPHTCSGPETAGQFVRWLRTDAVPDGAAITYDAAWVLKSDLLDVLWHDLPPATRRGDRRPVSVQPACVEQ